MVKADGCVAIHADGGAYKPLNWMNAPNTLVVSPDRWIVTNPKGETLTITLHEVISDVASDLGEDPGLQKDGVEAHLQELLAASPHAIEAGLSWCGASTRRRSVRSTSSAATPGPGRRRRGQAPRRDRRRRATRPLHRTPAARLLARRRPRRVRRPVDQAPGEGARRVARLPLGRGRLRRAPRPPARRPAVVLNPHDRSRSVCFRLPVASSDADSSGGWGWVGYVRRLCRRKYEE